MKRGGPLRQVSDTRRAKLREAGIYLTSTFAPRPTKRARPVPGPAASEGFLARPSTGHRVEADLAAVVRKRSGGRCEIGIVGCWGDAREKSHRIARGAGGRHGAAKRESDRPSNVMDACIFCHLTITRYASRVDAKGNGWVLKDYQDPAREPVLYRGELSYLDDLGGVHEFERAGA